jgi:hypothetical protein
VELLLGGGLHRADEGGAPFDLLAAGGGQGRAEARGEHVLVGGEAVAELGLVGEDDLGPAVGDLRVRFGDGFRQVLQEREASGEEFGAVAGEVGVPGVEGGHLGAAGAAAAGLLREVGGAQQGVALLEDPLVVGADAGVAGEAGAQQLVEVAAARGRLAADEREVFGGERDGLERADDLAGALEVGAVQAGLVRLAGDDREFGEEPPGVVEDLGPDDGLLAALPDQRGVGGDPVGAEVREVDQGLNQVGLAVPVGAHEDRGPLVEQDLGVRVGPEVAQLQLSYTHASIVPLAPRATLASPP